MTDTRSFRRWVRWLNRNFPLRCSFKAFLRAPEERDALGYAHWAYGEDGRVSKARIYVRPNLDESHTAETLIHEWAHVLRAQVPVGNPESEDDIQALIERAISNKWDAKNKGCGEPNE